MRLFMSFYRNLRKENSMIKVMFICHGNICRSPMCEYIFKDMVRKLGVSCDFEIASAATSREEIGCDIYPPAKKLLKSKGIPFDTHHARQVTAEDYDKYDHLIIMERYNYINLCRIIKDDPEGKIAPLLYFAGVQGDIADPWYSGDFEQAYEDIVKGCEGLLKYLGY